MIFWWDFKNPCPAKLRKTWVGRIQDCVQSACTWVGRIRDGEPPLLLMTLVYLCIEFHICYLYLCWFMFDLFIVELLMHCFVIYTFINIYVDCFIYIYYRFIYINVPIYLLI